MARRRKSKSKPAPRRRRRISGVAKVSPAEVFGFGILGGVTGAFVRKLTPVKWNEYIRSGISGGGPVLVALMSPNTMKDPRAMAFGIGMSAVGGVGIVNKAAPKLLAGLGNVNLIAGFDDVKRIAGYDTGRSYASMPKVNGVSSVAGGSDYMMAIAEDLE